MKKPAKKKAAKKAAKKVAAKPAAKVEVKPATPVVPKKPSRSDDPHAAVRELHELFMKSPPPGAEGGVFHTSVHSGLAQRVLDAAGKSQLFDYPLADGAYRVKGSPWTFAFQGGKLIQAVHAQVKQLIAGKVTEIDA